MISPTSIHSPARPVLIASALIAAIGASAIIGAYIFQYGLGLAPCPLCLQQRTPYYIAIPIAAALLAAVPLRAPRSILIAGLAIIALAMLYNSGLGIYHSGIEWKLWEGPKDCSGPVTDFGRAGSLLGELQNVRVVRCDEAPWRFLGLSLAGYNAPISLLMAAIAIWGIMTTCRSAYGSSSVSQ